MRLLHVYVKNLESKELRGEEMAYMEEVSLISRAKGNSVPIFCRQALLSTGLWLPTHNSKIH